MDNNINTFPELLSLYKIEIPMLQRDYAQGREDEKSKTIRQNFVKKLLDAVIKGVHIELDFIYGPIINNTLIPIDGQQRLTTLFLLHWYFSKIGMIKDHAENLKNFSYKVRTSTQDFINALLACGNDIIPESGVSSLRDEILDAKWYYSMWNYDPSIQSMINVLGEIHKQVNERKLNASYAMFGNIRFHLLNMEKYNLSSELYLKMNARGLPLSDFENFKAWLQGYCDQKIENNNNNDSKEKYSDDNYFSEKNEDYNKKWTTKIDKEWTDLFWAVASYDDKKFDSMFINYFNRLALLHMVNSNNADNDESRKIIIDKLETLSFSLYEEYRCFTQSNLNGIFFSLDVLSDLKNNLGVLEAWSFEEGSIFEAFIQDKPPYHVILRFYAFFKYVLLFKGDFKNKEFAHYRRVMRNIIENSTIDKTSLESALRLVDELATNASKGILQFLDKVHRGNEKIKSNFAKNQIQEECHKAYLILSDDNGGSHSWGSIIINAENHHLFRGQIQFLLVKQENELNLADLNKDDFALFKAHYEKAFSLWDWEGKYKGNYSLIKALLTQYVDSIQKIDNAYLKQSDENWKELLKRKDIRYCILKLFEQLESKSIDDIIRGHTSEQWPCLLINNDDKLINEYSYVHSHDKDVVVMKTRKGAWETNTAYLSKRRDIFIKNILTENEIIILEDEECNTEKRRILIEENGFLRHQWYNLYLPINNDVIAAITVEYDNYAWMGIRKTARDLEIDKYNKLLEHYSEKYRVGNKRNDSDSWWYCIRELSEDEYNAVCQKKSFIILKELEKLHRDALEKL